ncbi:hypothetical protein Tco_1006411 [Tanacetum coccineum]|uniref:Uncharacterized protein n=1 Tax=Tanacetum coccineum TaxID=301880 RepID=A0ABQ5FHV7_9ASTR
MHKQSRFLRYIDTRPNGDALRKCILEGPYTPSTVTILVVPATDESLEVPERTTVETIMNMSPENKAHYESEKESIHLLLTGIEDEIYSTIDACKTAHEMWIVAHERLQNKSPSDHTSALKGSETVQKEVNEIRPERIAKNANLVAPNKNVDTSPRYKNENQTGQFRNQRTVTFARVRETVGSQETKRLKDYTYHKEKMLLCKQAKKGVPLQAVQADWLADTDEEIDEQELEAH